MKHWTIVSKALRRVGGGGACRTELTIMRRFVYVLWYPKDDSYTGRGRIEQRGQDLSLRHCNRVAAEQKSNTNRSGEAAEFMS